MMRPSPSTEDREIWAVDSGATHSMCNNRKLFDEGSLRKVNYLVRMGSADTITASEMETVKLLNLLLTCLFIPEFRISLLSVSQLDLLGFLTVTTAE